MKMEQTECSETSAYKIQTPGNYPEENIQHTEHSESLKSRILLLTYSMEQSPQLVKKFPAFYGTRRFTTAFTSARHLSLSWASSIQSMPPSPNFWRSILILSPHLCLSLLSGILPSSFPILYTPLLSPIRTTCPAHLLLLLDLIIRIIFREQCRSLTLKSPN